MTFRKSIPTFLLYLVFAILGPLYVFIYATDFFVGWGEDYVLNSGLFLTVILVGCVLLAYFTHELSGMIFKKRPHKEEYAYKVWMRVSKVVTILLIISGSVLCISLAQKAPTPETSLFRLIQVPDAVFDDYKTKIYASVMNMLMGVFGRSVSDALMIQTALFIFSVILMTVSIRILAGRLAGILVTIFMFFLPVYNSAITAIQPDVIFDLMLALGFLAGVLYKTFVAESERKISLVFRILMAVFTGFLTGVLTGWDFGLIVLLLIPLFSFAVYKVKKLRLLPMFLVYLLAFVLGYMVSTGFSMRGAAIFVSQLSLRLPLPVMTYTTFYFVLASLTMLAVPTFFATHRIEHVSMWMIFTCYAMYIANQVPASGVCKPGFAILIMITLACAAASSLLISAANDAPETEEEALSKRGKTKHKQTKPAKPAPAHKPAPEKEKAKKEPVEETKEESKKEEAPSKPLSPIEELGAEELYIPSGMVLPKEDEDVDNTPREVPLNQTDIGMLSLSRSTDTEENLRTDEAEEVDALLKEVGDTITAARLIEEVGGEAEARKILEEYEASQEQEAQETAPAEEDEQESVQESVQTEEDEGEAAEGVTQATVKEAAEDVQTNTPTAVTDENGEVYQFYRAAESEAGEKADLDFDLPLVNGDDFDI